MGPLGAAPFKQPEHLAPRTSRPTLLSPMGHLVATTSNFA
eukprot:CAMPEP_0195090392 /NCGR_PEP_ID=MMETSP0448-20130528/29388_1 /TAXON_ID=66468 /ORGANISM="Heterocapsa triquestra, Strain CCMP 448" /LENGTH=39 /DNA_ID= /DNA_START= /DNA_END= /DNA_ORIENTATION=